MRDLTGHVFGSVLWCGRLSAVFISVTACSVLLNTLRTCGACIVCKLLQDAYRYVAELMLSTVTV